MRPEDRNLAYLWDMREAAREIFGFVKGVKYKEFVENRMIRYAVERQLMVIGEAANHISEKFQDEHPDIPWRQLVGQRNVLAHEYGDINVERIWSAATINLKQLTTVSSPERYAYVESVSPGYQAVLVEAGSEHRSAPVSICVYFGEQQ